MEKAQVLIVEDDGIIAMDLESRMKQLGYGVTGVAGYGEQAIEKVKENTPDVVLMDIILKGEIDGIEAAEEIRTQYDIPVIFITGYADKERLKRAKLAYPFGFIIKPFSDKDLEITIEMALYVAKVDAERRKAEEALRKSEKELSIRNRIAEIFIKVPDDKMYYEVLQVVLEAMESPFGTFAYINENGDRVVPVLTRDIWVDCKVNDADRVFPREIWTGIWGQCLVNKESVISSGPFRVPEGHIPITKAMAVPIFYKGEAIGNFMVANKTSDYSEKDKELLENIAGKLAPILHARLHRDRQNKERKQAEEDLKKSEAKYRTLFEVESDALFLVDKDTGNLLEANEAACKLYGYSHEELVGLKAWDLSAEPEKTKKAIKIVEKTFLPIRYHKKKDGTIFSVEISANDFTLDGRKINLSAIRDITERKQAEEALRESEERFRLAFECANDGVCLVDTDGSLMRVNMRMCEIFGYSKEELEGMTVNDIAHPEDKDVSPKFIRQGLSGEVESTIFEKRYFHKQGHIIWGQVSSSIIKDAKGDPLCFISHVQDITERKQLEK